MSAPYANLKCILAEAGMTVVDRPLPRMPTINGFGQALGAALIENPDGAVHFSCPSHQAYKRRVAAKEYVQQNLPGFTVAVRRLDSHMPGGASRTSPWEATLVREMKAVSC